MLNYNHYPKYADSTYRRMTKDKLIGEIHCLLHNWESYAIVNERISKYAEKIIKATSKDNLTKILSQYYLNTKDESEINDLVNYIIKELHKEQ